MKLLLLTTLIPLLAAFLSALWGSLIKKYESAIAICATFFLSVLSLKIAQATATYKYIIYKIGGWDFPLGILLVSDGLSSLLLVTVNIVALMAMIYSSGYMRHHSGKWKFYSLFMLMLTGINGVIVSGDLFNLFVFLELASICSYILVSFDLGPENFEASFKYAVMGEVASIFILLGIGLLYSFTSTLNMAEISHILATKPDGFLIGFISVLFLAGFGFKAALVPFHAWLADAHSSAPIPAVLLSGVFIKALGVYTIARVFFNVIGIADNVLHVLIVLGLSSMVLGALLAMAQNDIKRLLAYSTISQAGYIVFALGIGTPLAILGGLFHIFNHAAAKSLLFLDAGSIEHATGRRELNKLGGLNSKMPFTSNTSLIGAMSISGIPPFGGFWSKLTIIIAAIQAGYIGFSAIAILVSIVTLIYYLRLQNSVFFGQTAEYKGEVKKPFFSMKLAMAILALVCVAGGLLLLFPMRVFLTQAADSLAAGINYKDAVIAAIR